MHPPVLRRGIPYYAYYTAARVRPGDRGTREVGRRRREIKKGKAWCCRGSGTSPCVAVQLMRAGRRLDAAISLPPPPFAQTAQAQETALKPGAPPSALCSCAPAVNGGADSRGRARPTACRAGGLGGCLGADPAPAHRQARPQARKHGRPQRQGRCQLQGQSRAALRRRCRRWRAGGPAPCRPRTARHRRVAVA